MVFAAAVGAVGVPVRAGEANGAFRARAVFTAVAEGAIVVLAVRES